MIQKTMEPPVHPFRPPKSPSSIVVHKNTHNVLTPKSPTRRRHKSRNDSHKSNSKEGVSDAVSPTSVVGDPYKQRTRKHQSERRGGADKPASNEAADRSLVEAANQCMKVRKSSTYCSYMYRQFPSYTCVTHAHSKLISTIGV